jgi:CubicO group peptidase (beta-lactamase class C family)
MGVDVEGELRRLLDAAVVTPVEGQAPMPSATLAIRGSWTFDHHAGAGQLGDRYDLASLTKILVTTPAMARWASLGFDLDRPVADVLPRVASGATARALLAHRSGLPAWTPFFAPYLAETRFAAVFRHEGEAAGAAGLRQRVLDDAMQTPAAGPRETRYSDVGFLILGALLEALEGRRLGGREGAPGSFLGGGAPTLLGRRGCHPTQAARPRPPAAGQEGMFEYGVGRDPGPGYVDDDNAFACGGIAGHAGLFGAASEVADFGRRLLEDMDGATHLDADPETWSRFLPPRGRRERGLGFDFGPDLGSGEPSFGHLGFTGTSLWMDRPRRLSVALLTNRTAPGREHVAPIRRLRERVHQLVARTA